MIGIDIYPWIGFHRSTAISETFVNENENNFNYDLKIDISPTNFDLNSKIYRYNFCNNAHKNLYFS